VIISVPSFEDAVKKIKAAGGEILGPKMTVPSVGYMTYCRDTEGNIFGIMQNDPKSKVAAWCLKHVLNLTQVFTLSGCID
jgi:hypothetical protein